MLVHVVFQRTLLRNGSICSLWDLLQEFSQFAQKSINFLILRDGLNRISPVLKRILVALGRARAVAAVHAAALFSMDGRSVTGLS